MLRRTNRYLTSIADTCVPSHFVYATDLAFYFPRFQPRVHLQTHALPELRDAVALLQPPTPDTTTTSSTSATPPKNNITANTINPCTPHQRWCAPIGMEPSVWALQRDKALALLLRGEEIMESAGGLESSITSNVLRALRATKFELLHGVEHLPRSASAHRYNVQRLILNESGRLLYFNDAWDKSDVGQLDTACVILAHFIRAFCALHERPFHATQTTQGGGKQTARSANGIGVWSMSVAGGGELTLALVMERLEELLRLSRAAAEAHATSSPELRWTVPKLLLLKGILTIPLTGHLEQARRWIDEAAETVHGFLQRKMPIVDGLLPRRQEAELGLFMLAQAEMAARVFDWSVGVDEVDKYVLEKFEAAAKFYSVPYNNTLQADGIMSPDDIHEREFETDAYATCLLSYGTFLLNATRPPGKSSRDRPVFLPQQLFTRSPIMTAMSSSDIIFADVRDLAPMRVDVSRKKAGEAFERALQLNRILYPEQKQNPKAGWTLLGMACLYADMRDYLYATGLFASADKTISQNYGPVSREQAFATKLRYEFLAGVGSEQEAKTAQHEVVSLLARIDRLCNT